MSKEITGSQLTYYFEEMNANVKRLNEDVLGLHKTQNETNANLTRLNEDVLGLHKTQNEMNLKLDQIIDAINVLSTKINDVEATNAYLTKRHLQY